MSARVGMVVCAVLFAALATRAAAEMIVRDSGLIETMPIAGVTLAMTPREALEKLLAEGYSAGDIETYEDWETPGVTLARGGAGSPEGEYWVTLDRRGDRLVVLTLNRNRGSASLIDPQAEIGAAQSHFGLAADAPNCRVNDFNTGSCMVRDNAGDDVNLVFSMTAYPATMIASATRKKELALD